MTLAMGNIIWLASYPKSGNTWFRAFLSALFSEDFTVDINNLTVNKYVADTTMFENATNLNASELLRKEIDELKPEVMRYYASLSDENIYVKIHDKFKLLGDEVPIIPIEETKVVLYFVRNPLDVVVSYAHHDNLSLDRVIERMNQNYLLFDSKNREFFNLPEELGTWSNHVLSWNSNDLIKVHTIRFEDMVLDTAMIFKQAVEAMGLSYSVEEIIKAINSCEFIKLQEQENKTSFKEKSSAAPNFFRQGKIGNWREHLNKDQVDKIIEDHYTVMLQLNYIDVNGSPLY